MAKYIDVEPCVKDGFDRIANKNFDYIKIDDMPTADVVAVNDVEAWLLQTAINNIGDPLGDACEEIIRRLDGLKKYSSDVGGKHDELS